VASKYTQTLSFFFYNIFLQHIHVASFCKKKRREHACESVCFHQQIHYTCSNIYPPGYLAYQVLFYHGGLLHTTARRYCALICTTNTPSYNASSVTIDLRPLHNNFTSASLTCRQAENPSTSMHATPAPIRAVNSPHISGPHELDPEFGWMDTRR
jgi:hypothetical protein